MVAMKVQNESKSVSSLTGEGEIEGHSHSLLDEGLLNFLRVLKE